MKFVVVGGGTAGTLSAMLLRSRFPESSVTLIDNSKIGVIGVGEGTTQNFARVLRLVGMDPGDMANKIGAYPKGGFRFENWTIDEPKSFVHPFGNYIDTDNREDLYKIMDVANAQDGNLDNIHENSYWMLKDKIIDGYFYQNEMGRGSIYKKHAWHIDGGIFADYVKDLAKDRDIIIVDKAVKEFKLDISNNVVGIVLDDEEIIESDFVIDSTGFARKIIGNLYNTEWVSVKEYAPNDRAIAFSVFNKKPVPYSNSVAMNNGWIWEISLQHRYGCGYVFSSDHATDEEIIEEIYSRYGKDNVKIMRTIAFDPGYYKKLWVNNVLAVGLSGSFFEPIEATSIQYSLNVLYEFLNDDFATHLKNPKDVGVINHFNERMSRINDGIVSFINLHYQNNRRDTEYWRDVAKHKVHPITASIIDKIKNKQRFESHEEEARLHGEFSWLSIYSGNHLYNKEELIVDNEKQLLYNNRVKYVKDFENTLSAEEFLNKIMENK